MATKDNNSEVSENSSFGRTSSEKIEQLINKFREISIASQSEAEIEKNKPKFILLNEKVPVEQLYLKIVELQEEIEEYGFDVVILDDIEHKNASSGGKYTVRIQDTNNVYIEFDLLEYKEKIKDWDFDELAYIAQFVSKITGDTSKRATDIGRCIVEYLSILMYYPERYTKIYKNLGWDYLNNQLIFKYDRIYSNEKMQSECIGEVRDSLKPHAADNLDEKLKWIDFTINNVLNYSVVDSLLLGAGISGVVRQLLPYTKETNININIVGERASGKSTIGHYIISIFGDTSKLEGSFVDTVNKVDEIRATRSVLPYVLDERMLRVEETNDRARKRAIIMDIFREYEGKVKERIGKQYSNISGERTCGPIISSSVRSIMDEIYDYADLGQFRRFTELKIIPSDLFKSREISEEAERIANSHYGYGVDLIISYLLDQLAKNENYVIDSYDNVKAYVDEYLNQFETNGLGTSAQRFSLLILSYKVLRESFIHYFEVFNNTSGDLILNYDIPDKTDEILELLSKNLLDKMQRVDEQKKRKSTLPDYIKKYKDAFFEFSGKDTKWDVEGGKHVPYIGKVKIADHAIELIIRQPYELELILFSYKDDIPDPVQIRKYIDLCEDSTKSPEKATMLNKLKRIDKEDVDEFLAYNTWISVEGRDKQRSKKFGTDKGERALIIRIDLEQYEKGGQE